MAGRILVPLDGSELGEAALPWASEIARAHQLTLVLLRVIPWQTYVMTGGMDGYVTADVYDELRSAEQETASGYLNEVRDRLAQQGLEVETVIREGEASDAILDAADEQGPLAIAMSTHGRGGLSRLMHGSVAERVLQHATIPVLLIRAGRDEAPAPGLKRLLVPLDGSRLAERALDVAMSLATDGTTLILTQVIKPVRREITSAEGIAAFDDPEATRQVVPEAERYLSELTQAYGARSVTFEIVIQVGEAADEIMATADGRQADLIVMGTHGRTGPARLWIGSVADKTVRQAHHPVFLVSARALAARVAGDFTAADMMTRDLATVREDDTLVAAMRKLIRRRVSGLPVVNAEDELVGVLSEADLLRWQKQLIDELAKDPSLAPGEYSRRLETTPVRDLMTHPAISVQDTATLSEALHFFLDRQLGRLPVIRDDRLVGIVTRADVIKAMAAQWELTSGESAVEAGSEG